jgi:hypothetical protein
MEKDRPECVWKWGAKIRGKEKVEEMAEKLGVTLCYGEPVLPGDLYIAMRNTGPHLLTCKFLGDACVFPKEVAYPYDFNEVVKIV